MLAAPATLERVYDFPETAFDAIVEILRASTPCVVLDIPHGWTAWMRRLIFGADEIVIVATPDLANLRNAKSLLDTIRAARPNDAKPRLILNFMGVPKRPEISGGRLRQGRRSRAPGAHQFRAEALRHRRQQRPNDRRGRPANKINETISELARAVTGRTEIRESQKDLLEPLKLKLGLSRAS